MSDPIVKTDLHGLRQEEAVRTIERALSSVSAATYQLQLIHGYHRGISLRSMIKEWYQNDSRILRIMPGDNPGITMILSWANTS